MNEKKATDATPQKGPGLIRKAANFSVAVARHVADGGRNVTDEVCLARLIVCAACPSFNPEKIACGQRKCGCRLKTKARWRSEKCPLDKWPREES